MSCKQLVKIKGICHYLTIDIEDDKIDPRSDKRIEEVLKKLRIEYEN